MREHAVEERPEGWAVLVRGRGVEPDEVVAECLPEAAARRMMHERNAAQMGRLAAPSVGAHDARLGCTCRRPILLPTQAPPVCPVHG